MSRCIISNESPSKNIYRFTEELLTKDVFEITPEEFTPEEFMQAININDIKTVNKYSRYYANIHVHNISPLLIAYRNGNIEIMNILLANYADINEKYKGGYTLLDHAKIMNNKNMIVYLEIHGAI